MAKTVKFTADFDFKWPGGGVISACKGGTTDTVKDEVADAAILAGKAELIEKPVRVTIKDKVIGE